jgi:DNA-binding CsgD family transcriptional regulator
MDDRAVFELTDPDAIFVGPVTTLDSVRREFSRSEVARGLNLEWSIIDRPSDLALHCEITSQRGVYASGCYATRRQQWSRSAPNVIVRKNAFYRVRDGKIVHSWHNTNSSELWRNIAKVDALERRRGNALPLALSTEDPTSVESLQLAFLAWGLSTRLREVARLMIAGHTDKEIANDLRLAENTIRGYVKEIRQRAGIRRREDLYRAGGYCTAS